MVIMIVLENVFAKITCNGTKGILLSIACLFIFLHLVFVCVYLVFKK